MVENIRPLFDRVLVKRSCGEEKTSGGIIIPDVAKEKGQTGLVVAVGAGKLDTSGKAIPMQVKVGDKIFFGKYAGTEANDSHIIIREEEILGVLEK